MNKKRLFYILLALLLLKAAVLALFIVFGSIHLAPDEAQYWTWSKDLDWGYYSKPPGIAWQIALTTAFLGNTELGVRFGALFIGFATPIILFFLAPLRPKASFFAALALAFSPIGFFLSFAATTDGGSILFFLLAALLIARGLENQQTPNYLLIGLLIFLGALFKWVAFAFWPLLIFSICFFPVLRSRKIAFGILISLLALLPSLYWNWTHDFATFRHVGATLFAKSGDSIKPSGNPLDFLGAQVGLFSPFYFVFLCIAFYLLYKSFKEKRSSLRFLGIFPLTVLLFVFVALFRKMQPNWALFLWPGGYVLVGWVCEWMLKRGSLYLYLSTILSVILLLGAMMIPCIQEKSWLSSMPIPYKVNPFRHNVGWQNLPALLDKAGYDSKSDFLFGDKYQTASLLSFYGPGKKRAYFFNVNLQRKNQFSYWPSMPQKEVGHNGYFVVIENAPQSSQKWYEEHYLKILQPYFEKVEVVAANPLFSAYGEGVKQGIVLRGVGYKGNAPVDPEKY